MQALSCKASKVVPCQSSGCPSLRACCFTLFCPDASVTLHIFQLVHTPTIRPYHMHVYNISIPYPPQKRMSGGSSDKGSSDPLAVGLGQRIPLPLPSDKGFLCVRSGQMAASPITPCSAKSRCLATHYTASHRSTPCRITSHSTALPLRGVASHAVAQELGNGQVNRGRP